MVMISLDKLMGMIGNDWERLEMISKDHRAWPQQFH
jgi:hypothetical protein